MTRTQLIVERNNRRKEIRKKIHRFIASIAGLMAVTALILMCTDDAAAEEDTFIRAEYIRYCEKIGKEHGIAPELLEALIETESAGKADAKSRTGDVGLCQINPRWSRYTEEELKDPYTNIEEAATILEGLFEKYDLEGLMAYNYGEYSEAFRSHMQKGTMSEYAKKIIKRSDYLQELHGRE